MEESAFKSGYVCNVCGLETESINEDIFHYKGFDTVFEIKGKKYAKTHFEECGKWKYFDKRLS